MDAQTNAVQDAVRNGRYVVLRTIPRILLVSIGHAMHPYIYARVADMHEGQEDEEYVLLSLNYQVRQTLESVISRLSANSQHRPHTLLGRLPIPDELCQLFMFGSTLVALNRLYVAAYDLASELWILCAVRFDDSTMYYMVEKRVAMHFVLKSGGLRACCIYHAHLEDSTDSPHRIRMGVLARIDTMEDNDHEEAIVVLLVSRGHIVARTHNMNYVYNPAKYCYHALDGVDGLPGSVEYFPLASSNTMALL